MGYYNPIYSHGVDSFLADAKAAGIDEILGEDDVVYLPVHHQVVVWAMKDWLDIPVVADNGVRFIYTRINR